MCVWECVRTSIGLLELEVFYPTQDTLNDGSMELERHGTDVTGCVPWALQFTCQGENNHTGPSGGMVPASLVQTQSKAGEQ